jgi:hypothetical protein
MPVTAGEGRTLAGLMLDMDREEVCTYMVIAVRHGDHAIRTASNIEPDKQVWLLMAALFRITGSDPIVIASPDDEDYTGH